MSEDQRLVFITVVRDFDFYDRFFINNGNVNVHTLVPIDNRADNLYITTQYNRFWKRTIMTTPRGLFFATKISN